MEESRKLLIGSILALGIVLGLAGLAWSTQEVQGKDRTYKNFLESLNGSVKSLRVGGDPSGSLGNAKSYYNNLVSGENFANQPELGSLDNKISQAFENMTGKNAKVSLDDVQNLKSNVSKMASELGGGVPFIIKNASLIILFLSIPLAFVANVLCRELMDWESYREAENTVDNWKSKIQDAKRKKGKKRRKLELKDEEFSNARDKLWATDIKQAGFYIAFFVLFLAWFSFIYGDWIVAWVPFNWFSSGLLSSYIGVSFSVFGWFLLSYFGFAFLWREIILSDSDSEHKLN